MMKRKRCFILCILTCCILMLVSCRNVDKEPDKNPDNAASVKSPADPPAMDDIVLDVMRSYPNPESSEEQNVYYILCVSKDGAVYSMDYSYETHKELSYFLYLFRQSDDYIWKQVENKKLLGNLSDDEMVMLNDSIKKVDVNSEYITEMVRPEAIAIVDYTVSCYVLDTTGNRKNFHIISWAANNGKYGATSDIYAMEAWEVLEDSQIFKDWKAGFDDNRGMALQ